MLKDTWVDRKNDVDYNNANDLNKLAKAIIDLEKNTVAKSLLDDYINGALAMPSPAVKSLTVFQTANFGGRVIVPQPQFSDSPATKQFVEDKFANIKLAEDGEY